MTTDDEKQRDETARHMRGLMAEEEGRSYAAGAGDVPSEEYNGWPNYETWATTLHIDNEQIHYEARRELARNAIARGLSTYDYAQILKEYVLENLIDQEWHGGLGGDLIGRAIERIDWMNISHGYLYEERDELAGSVRHMTPEDRGDEIRRLLDPNDYCDVEGIISLEHWLKTGDWLDAR